MSTTVSVSTQGVNAEMTATNGEFDELERGTMTRPEFSAFLTNIAQLQDLTPDDPNIEYCSAQVLVELDDTSREGFILYGKGEIGSLDLDGSLSIEECVSVAFGERTIEDLAAERPESTEEKEAEEDQSLTELEQIVLLKAFRCTGFFSSTPKRDVSRGFTQVIRTINTEGIETSVENVIDAIMGLANKGYITVNTEKQVGTLTEQGYQEICQAG